MAPTFTPPVVAEVPPIFEAGTPQAQANPLGQRLMRFYPTRERGTSVFAMADGTYRINRPVEGVSNGTTIIVGEPYPAVPSKSLQNGPYLGAVFNPYDASGGTVPEELPLTGPEVTYVYYGGRTYSISEATAIALVAAGFREGIDVTE